MIIGVTGSIGSGKTTVANLFKKYAFSVIDADEIGHSLMQKNSAIYKKLRNFFGDEILNKNKEIDRTKLGSIVFNDTKTLKKLDSITHPIIIKEINKQKKSLLGNFFENIIIDAPLLLETKTKKIVDKIIVVKADKGSIIKRLGKKYPKEKLKKILGSQMPLEEKLKYADFVVDNDKDLRHLEEEVKNIIKKIRVHKIRKTFK